MILDGTCNAPCADVSANCSLGGRCCREVGIGRALANSIFLSATTAVLGTLICAAAGYASAALRFRGRKSFEWLVLAALIIPPPLLIAPSY